MYLDDPKTRKALTKWVVGTIAACILFLAVSVVVRSVTDGMDQLAALEHSGDLSELPFAQTLAELEIDWISLKTQLVDWVEQLSTTILNASADALGKVASSLLDFVVGIVFALYILSSREKLLYQLKRLA